MTSMPAGVARDGRRAGASCRVFRRTVDGPNCPVAVWDLDTGEEDRAERSGPGLPSRHRTDNGADRTEPRSRLEIVQLARDLLA